MSFDQGSVLASYEQGVVALTEGVVEDWDEPVCGRWNATDLAGHLLNVVSWYHNWLDLAETGISKAPWSPGYMNRMTKDSLAAMPRGSGPDRLEEFALEARRYASRLPAVWDIAYGYPRGTVHAGGHAAIAAVEWHLHAWDLTGGKHEPVPAQPLAEAAGTTSLLVKVPFRFQRVAAKLVPKLVDAEIARRGGPWETLLHHSGRS